ncbi:MAG: hypothetical protein K8E66_10635, partial [Phycisphaerales bacterium]|nr:hypothetical protein [Phycisphaerales bacterium]
MQTVFLNGEFVERDRAMLSAFDAGFQHGVGLFETMLGVRRGDGAEVIGVGAHADRLCDSARLLRLSEDLHADGLAQAVTQTFERSGLERARL